MTSKPDHPRDLLFAVTALITRLNANLTGVLAELDLTLPQCYALLSIDPQLPPPAMKTLAARLHCDPSSVTFLSDRLTERGIAERITDPADRRSKALRLTDKGVSLREQLVELAAKASPLAALTGTDQRALLDLITRSLAAAD